MRSIHKEIRLECRPNNESKWQVLNRAFYSEGNTPTEKRERENVLRKMHEYRAQWQQRFERFATHQFRLVTE